MHEMTDLQIDQKHRRIRKSDRLKYAGNEFRCLSRCGNYHDEVDGDLKQHRCVLTVAHPEEFCAFTSECGERKVRPKSVTLVVDGVAA